MLASTTASSTISTHTNPVLSESSVRSGRLRGLSHLRNHLHHPTCSGSGEEHTDGAGHQSRTEPDAESSSSPQHEHSRNLLRQLEGFRVFPRPSTTGLSAQDTHTEQAPSMARHRSITSPISSRAAPSQPSPGWLGLDFGVFPQSSDGGPNVPANNNLHQTASSLPSIQFIPATEPHRSRPSLDFRRVTRILPNTNSVIRVGRYSEKDNAADTNSHLPSDAPIGFKSKVVSRRHCEFSYVDNQWYVKDVKSSSGTFLNHIRLSQPGLESKPFPVNDGDIVQLGIDFKGGEEMIFRCVKIRIETNRGWQKGLNKFNKSTHKQLQQLAKGAQTDSDAASKHSTECTICLNSIAPCQALFVAPCSHTWHFKCIRTILDESRSGQFLCPNCRAQADLDADVEEEELEDFEVYDSHDEAEHNGTHEDADENEDQLLENRLPSPPRQCDSNTFQSSLHNHPAYRTQSASDGLGLRLNRPAERAEHSHSTSPNLRTTDSPSPPTYLNPDDLSWTLSSLSLRQQNKRTPSIPRRHNHHAHQPDADSTPKRTTGTHEVRTTNEWEQSRSIRILLHSDSAIDLPKGTERTTLSAVADSRYGLFA